MMKQEIKRVALGYCCLTAHAEIIDGEVMDTEIRLDGSLLCCVAGSEVDQFVKRMVLAVEKHRI